MTSEDKAPANGKDGDTRKPWDSDMHRERRGKNRAFLITLLSLIVLFYLGYMARMGGFG